MKRNETTGKIEPYAKFLKEEKISFQRAISQFVSKHDIPLDLMLNLHQTPLFYVSPGKYIFDLKGSTTAPIKVVDDKRQITAAFTVFASGSFLPIQFICNGKTKHCLLKYDFPNCFLHSLQIISSILKSVSACLAKLSFPTLKRRKKNLITQRSNTL